MIVKNSIKYKDLPEGLVFSAAGRLKLPTTASAKVTRSILRRIVAVVENGNRVPI